MIEEARKAAALTELPVRIHIDAPNPTAIPASVLAGIGNRKLRYKSWLDKAFTENTELLRFLAFIYKTKKENQNTSLVCHCKSALPGKHYHADAINEWLDENHETLDTLLPYLFDRAEQDVSASVTTNSVTENKEQQLLPSSSLTGEQAVAQGIITADDLEQMKLAIQNDIAENDI